MFAGLIINLAAYRILFYLSNFRGNLISLEFAVRLDFSFTVSFECRSDLRGRTTKMKRGMFASGQQSEDDFALFTN